MGVRVIRFKIPVNCANAAQDAEEIYDDYGVVALPESYCETGQATRLVVFCHGAGGTVSETDSQAEQQTLTKYLLANGYAVMDVNGLPAEYAQKKEIDIRNNIGSPIAVQSYIKAYRYCIERFHLKKEAFVHGVSMGGISSTNLVLSNQIPVIAQSGFCPVLDTYHQIFLYPWSDGAPKVALRKLYGLTLDDNKEPVYDADKVDGYNPMSRLIRADDGKEYLYYPVPVKFWQCEDDEIVDIVCTKRFVTAMQNAGVNADLRTFESGGHEPQLYGDFVAQPRGNTLFGTEVLRITPAVEETYLWIKGFDR